MKGSESGYLALLRRNRGFRMLWLGQVISLLGDWLSYVAVLGLVLELTNSGLSVAVTMLSRAIPYAIFGMLSGVVLDRTDRKRVLILADVCRGLLAVAYLLIKSPDAIWGAYLIGGAMQSFSAFFNPGVNTIIPSVCKEEDCASANSLMQATQGATMVIGSALGGALVGLVGRDWSFAINGVSFFGSALCILVIAVPKVTAQRAEESPWAQFHEGVRFIRSQSLILGIILRRMGERLGAGFNMLLSVFAIQVWHAGEQGIGWIYSILGFGLIFGSWVAKRFANGRTHEQMQRTIGWGNVGEAVFWTAFALSPNLWVGAALMALMVASDIITTVTEVTIIQQTVPNHLLGRVFAARDTLLTLAWAVALSTTGVVSERFGPKTTAIGIGGVMMVTAIAWFVAVLSNRLTVGDGPGEQEQEANA